MARDADHPSLTELLIFVVRIIIVDDQALVAQRMERNRPADAVAADLREDRGLLAGSTESNGMPHPVPEDHMHLVAKEYSDEIAATYR